MKGVDRLTENGRRGPGVSGIRRERVGGRDRDRTAAAIRGRTRPTRVVMEMVSEYMRRTSVPMPLRRLTWPQAT
jgi:hypothetical protein